jgi:VWFA-related protein
VKRPQFLVFSLAALLGSFVFLSTVIVHGQSTVQDEIRVASEPYTPAPAGTIRVQSTVVEVDVVVKDSHGKAVPHLTRDDFQIFDSGKLQKISNFSVDQQNAPPPPPPEQLALKEVPAPIPTPPARYVGFYFDDNNMETNDLVFARKSAEKFVNTSMEEGDRVAVFTSSTTVTQGFTTDKTKLIAAMEKVVSHIRKASFGAGSCPHIEPYQAWQIALNGDVHSPAFDLALAEAVQCNCTSGDPSCPAQMARLVQVQAGVTLSLADQFSMDTLGVLGDIIRYVGRMPGKRMLVLTSGGFFALSKQVQKQQDKMIDQALHSGIRINTMDAKGLTADWLGGNPGDGPPIVLGGAMQGYIDEIASDTRSVSNDPLAALAVGTGGRFFHNNNDLEGGVRQMVMAPEVSYNIAFSPEELRPDGSYHSLKVRLVNNKGYSIETRPGYYAPNKASLAPAEKLEKLNKMVTSKDEIQGIQAGVVTKSIALATGESALRVEVHVDIRSLPFKKENGLHLERLIFITALFDDKDKFLSGVEGVMDMDLKEDTLKSLNFSGASANVSLQAPPGTYRLRQVVQEAVTGKIAAFNTPVEIH